jgi:hypothetical protein
MSTRVGDHLDRDRVCAADTHDGGHGGDELEAGQQGVAAEGGEVGTGDAEPGIAGMTSLDPHLDPGGDIASEQRPAVDLQQPVGEQGPVHRCVEGAAGQVLERLGWRRVERSRRCRGN